MKLTVLGASGRAGKQGKRSMDDRLLFFPTVCYMTGKDHIGHFLARDSAPSAVLAP